MSIISRLINLCRPRPHKIRTFRIEGPIDDEKANLYIAMLLYWQREVPKSAGRIEIDSPGGSVTATFAIVDTMALVGFPIHTHCPAYVAGCAALILARGAKGFRSAGENATVQMCPTMGGVSNSTADPAELERSMMRLRNHIVEEFRLATGRTFEEIADAQELERVFSAEEARTYGLIDHVCESKIPFKAESLYF